MAKTQTRHIHCSADDLCSGQLLPWLCAFSAIGLLSLRVGPVISAVVAAASALLLIAILAGAEWWVASSKTPSSLGAERLNLLSRRLTWRFSATRNLEALTSTM